MIRLYADGKIIDEIPETEEEAEEMKYREKTNCKNCGAPMSCPIGKCQYCGTVYDVMIRNW